MSMTKLSGRVLLTEESKSDLVQKMQGKSTVLYPQSLREEVSIIRSYDVSLRLLRGFESEFTGQGKLYEMLTTVLTVVDPGATGSLPLTFPAV